MEPCRRGIRAGLSLLYCAWRTAYLWDGRTDHHACEYLDRWLPNAVDRLAVRLRPCAERHHPDGPRRDDAELVDGCVHGSGVRV
ncbi:MAG TPA: hypothetical protein VFV66_09715 [Nonomuraea sp.]|nr:hypothetical protein [Nonomuraea sp.]